MSLIAAERLKSNVFFIFVIHAEVKIENKTYASIPYNFEDLKALPGIGNYTASAILAIAFNEPYIPLDGNIERVLKRYLYLKKESEIKKENLAQKKIYFW